jgi:hypothetical protein
MITITTTMWFPVKATKYNPDTQKYNKSTRRKITNTQTKYNPDTQKYNDNTKTKTNTTTNRK